MHIFERSLENIFGRSSYKDLPRKILGKGAAGHCCKKSNDTWLKFEQIKKKIKIM